MIVIDSLESNDIQNAAATPTTFGCKREVDGRDPHAAAPGVEAPAPGIDGPGG